MPTRRFYRRQFLNRRGFHAGAYVLASCALEVFRRPGGGTPTYSVEADFTVADCGRIAALDFCAHDEASAQNALHKVRRLRETINDFAVALESAIEDLKQHQP